MSVAFAIRYKDVTLDVSANSRLTIEWMSVLFNEDQLFAGSYSYPLTFPLTDRNKAALANAHLPENRKARKKLPVLVQLFGQSWKRAVLAFDVVANGYEGDLQIDSGTVAEWMRERSVASVFTVSENGKFVSFRKVKVSSDEGGRVDNILDSCQNPGKWPWVFFPLRNELRTGELEPVPGETPEEIEGNQKMHWFINEWGGGFFTPLENRLFTPFFYLTWVIKEVCDFLGFEARGSFLDHPEIRTWVIYNTGMIGGGEFNNPSLELCPAKHLPGMSIADFIKALRNDYKAAIYFDSHTRIAHFDLPDDILSRRDAVDIAGNVEVESLRIKHNPVQGFELKTMVDDGDECYKLEPYVKSYFVGSSEAPKGQDLQSGTLFMWRGGMYLNEEAEHRMPWARQTGNIYDPFWRETQAYNPENTYGKNDFKLRLIAYKGMVPWGTEGTSGMIPYATCDDLDQTEQPAYEYSLSPGGGKGWLTKFCLGWYDMLCNTEQTDMIARLPVTKFMQLAPLRKFLYSGNSRARLEALPDRITLEPSEQSGRIMVCRILAYPHYNMGGIAEEIKVGFTEGEVVKPEQKIYVRLSVENERFSVKESRHREKIVDVVLRFYRDSAGSLPMSVTDLPVRILENYSDTEGKNLTFNHTVTANGEVFMAMAGRDSYVWKKATVWNLWDGIEAWHQYSLDDSADDSYEHAQ